MAKLYDRIPDELAKFIQAQQIFFVATAPLSPGGHINLSPKGLDSFRILSPNRVAYLDLTGSGNETSAHLAENQRITFMFCAFQGKPIILRLYGQGQVLLPDSPDWQTHLDLFPAIPGTRQIIVAEIDRVQTSCGTGVPLYEFEGQRSEMVEWAEKKGASPNGDLRSNRGMWDYWQLKNQTSADGLPTPLSAWMERQ